MDKTSPSASRKLILKPLIAPAQLWVGQEKTVISHVTNYLQKQFCLSNGCSTCTICTQIAMHQFHALCWLNPEKSYTLEQIETIFCLSAYALENGSLFFFVIQNAESLTTACSNRLLKRIEEPPAGYHFLFITQRPQDILPTIQSRCILQSVHSEAQQPLHENLLACFTQKNSAPHNFLQALTTAAITEQESATLLDAILVYWLSEQKKATLKKDHGKIVNATTIINHLCKAMVTPPMQGSSKIFWKNLYLNLYG